MLRGEIPAECHFCEFPFTSNPANDAERARESLTEFIAGRRELL